MREGIFRSELSSVTVQTLKVCVHKQLKIFLPSQRISEKEKKVFPRGVCFHEKEREGGSDVRNA